MKRHTSIMLAAGLCLLTLFSCSPVEYPKALGRTEVEDKAVIYTTPHPKKADVSFTPVRNADSYRVMLGEEEQSVPMKLKDGLYTFTLRKLEPDTEYELSIVAENQKGSSRSVHSFRTLEDNGELEYAPVAYMSRRTDTTATIHIEKKADVEYRVAFNRNGIWELLVEDAEKGNYTVESLTSDGTYHARIDHRKKSDKEYSSEYTSLVIPKYRNAFVDDVVPRLEGTRIIVDNIMDKSFMTLLFYPDGSGVAIDLLFKLNS